MDMELAELPIEGKARKVLMTAPKNGFFYVLDRMNGKLISAQPIAKITWAAKIDPTTGRPVELPAARFPNGSTFEMWPSDIGAHSWQPMSFSPKSGLVYIPVIQAGALYRDAVDHYDNWKRADNGGWDSAVAISMDVKDPLQGTSYLLLAWDPVARKAAWKVNTPKAFDSGTTATAGNLVFQGDVAGAFNAYAADSGKLLWSFPARAPISSAPITYEAKGHQYVSILTGFGTSATVFAKLLHLHSVDYYTQARRVLTFTLDAKGALPPAEKWTATVLADPSFTSNATLAQRGAETYGHHCLQCHGIDAVSGGAAPDLRASAIPQSAEAFASVVHDGARLPNGMPRFDYLDDSQLNALRQYLRTEANKLRAAQAKP